MVLRFSSFVTMLMFVFFLFYFQMPVNMSRFCHWQVPFPTPHISTEGAYLVLIWIKPSYTRIQQSRHCNCIQRLNHPSCFEKLFVKVFYILPYIPLLKPTLLSSPSHQQPWYSLCETRILLLVVNEIETRKLFQCRVMIGIAKISDLK